MRDRSWVALLRMALATDPVRANPSEPGLWLDRGDWDPVTRLVRAKYPERA
ncbi:hypothetical protein GALLR39Z86_32610 [Glycomyces algeriensis]|uniref:Uncharacterized protein n=1 Tax=Glycomyces algeriensis TaxID=256037 RepID=A0A9W6LI80_9ACTN|nr:hypothetical protein GALLR39Z86_32610 [Glycomyces algeriensis]